MSLFIQTTVGVMPVMAGDKGDEIKPLSIGPTLGVPIVNPTVDGTATNSSPTIVVSATDTSDIFLCQYRYETTDTEGTITYTPETSGEWLDGSFIPDIEGVLTSGVCTSSEIDLPEGALYFSGQIKVTSADTESKESDYSDLLQITDDTPLSIDNINGEYLTNNIPTPPTIQGTVSDPSAEITVRVLGATPDDDIYFDVNNYNDGTWDTTIPDVSLLTDNQYTLEIVATNNNTSLPNEAVAVVSYVVDTTKPVINQHDDIYIVSPASIEVSYDSPDASWVHLDSIDPANCSPISGSAFQSGTTIVTCNKTDIVGNVADTTTFNVTVDQLPIINSLSFANRNGIVTDGNIVDINLAGVTQSDLDSIGHVNVSKISNLQINSPLSNTVPPLESGSNSITLFDLFGFPLSITPADLSYTAASYGGIIPVTGTLTDLFGNPTDITIYISMRDEESPVISMIGSDITIQ